MTNNENINLNSADIHQNDVKEKTAFLLDIIKRYDHYIATTNFKVGLMMSFIGAIILGLAVQVISIDPEPDQCKSLYYAVITSCLLTIFFALVSAFKLLKVVFPNTKNYINKTSLIFFGDVANIKGGCHGFTKAIESISAQSFLKDLSEQTFVLACIVDDKFKLIKVAVNILIYSVMPLLFISIILLTMKGIN